VPPRRGRVHTTGATMTNVWYAAVATATNPRRGRHRDTHQSTLN
jgi:hypothetical protein